MCLCVRQKTLWLNTEVLSIISQLQNLTKVLKLSKRTTVTLFLLWLFVCFNRSHLYQGYLPAGPEGSGQLHHVQPPHQADAGLPSLQHTALPCIVSAAVCVCVGHVGGHVFVANCGVCPYVAKFSGTLGAVFITCTHTQTCALTYTLWLSSLEVACGLFAVASHHSAVLCMPLLFAQSVISIFSIFLFERTM